MTDEELQKLVMPIFMPAFAKARDGLFERGDKLVHYTSAEVALSIIRTKRVWMRNALCMNDFSEVQHGLDLLRRFFAPIYPDRSPDLGQSRFRDALETVHSGVGSDAIDLFNGWIDQIEFGTFVTCLSEHSVAEDELGRLSMWRAYGKPSGRIAFVINPEPFRLTSDVLHVYAAPVSYFTAE